MSINFVNPKGRGQSQIDSHRITGQLFHKGILQVVKAVLRCNNSSRTVRYTFLHLSCWFSLVCFDICLMFMTCRVGLFNRAHIGLVQNLYRTFREAITPSAFLLKSLLNI